MPEVRPNEEKPKPQADIRYDRSLIAAFIRIEDHASDAEIAFLEKLLKRWNEGTFNLMEGALMEAGQEFGYTWLADPDDISRDRAEQLCQLDFILRYEDWLATLLRSLVHAHKAGELSSPYQLLWYVEETMREYIRRVDDMRKILRADPAVLADEIRAAAAKLAGGAK